MLDTAITEAARDLAPIALGRVLVVNEDSWLRVRMGSRFREPRDSEIASDRS